MFDQSYLKSILHYDQESGLFTWKVRPLEHFKDERAKKSWNTKYAGKITGYLRNDGYLEIGINYKLYLAHRLAWLYIYGVWPKMFLDHINHVVSDNRIVNLREATASENGQNQIKPRSNNKSGYLGVSYSKQNKKFMAQLKVNGEHITIGFFNTAEQASQSYLNAKRELHEFCTI